MDGPAFVHVSQHPFVQHRQTWMLIVHTFSPCWCRPGSFAVCSVCVCVCGRNGTLDAVGK